MLVLFRYIVQQRWLIGRVGAVNGGVKAATSTFPCCSMTFGNFSCIQFSKPYTIGHSMWSLLLDSNQSGFLSLWSYNDSDMGEHTKKGKVELVFFFFTSFRCATHFSILLSACCLHLKDLVEEQIIQFNCAHLFLQ